MNDEQFKKQLAERRAALRMSYRDIQRRTELSYNTVRRVFSEPMRRPLGTVNRVVRAMGCYLDFAIEQQIPDDIEPDIPIEPMTQKEADDAMAERTESTGEHQ